MASLQIYDRGAVFFDGKLLVECVSFTVKSDPKLNPINTMQKGFAGVSPGAEQTDIEVTEALPRAGFDYDALAALQGNDVVEFVCYLGSKKLKCKGFISGLDMATGVDKGAEVKFNFMGSPLESSAF